MGPDVRPARPRASGPVAVREVTQGKKFRIRFDRKVRYELDGGARPATKKLRIKVRPASVTVCVPPQPRPHR